MSNIHLLELCMLGFTIFYFLGALRTSGEFMRTRKTLRYSNYALGVLSFFGMLYSFGNVIVASIVLIIVIVVFVKIIFFD